jgi:hypothetical protein
MNDLNTVRESLDQAVATLADLRIAMREGQEVDLDAFNLMVAHTCKAAVELPQADAPKVRGQLERLLLGLNEVKADIEAEQAVIDARLAEIGAVEDIVDVEVIEVAEHEDGGPANTKLNGAHSDTASDD